MMKWIRWQGLAAFIVVVGSLMGLWFLFADGIVKTVIEKTGTAIVGAEVDVKADVKLFPLGITLEELQVTNPDAPETNSFECRRIAFDLDTLNLFRRKVIINEMAVEGMRFDTKRKRPGRVSREVKEQKRAGEERGTLFGLPIRTPDVKTILRNEKLESVNVIETAKVDLDEKRDDWKKRLSQLPDRAKIDVYRERIKKLRKQSRRDVLGIAGQLAEVRAIQRDIEQDTERVKQARAAFASDLGNAKTLVERAVQAPMNDVRRLRDKYSISPAGLANISQLLFGGEIASWVRTALLWRNRIEPVVERAKAQRDDVTVVKPVRGKGVDVRFKEYRPLPDFLIDRTTVSAETAAGLLSGTVRNITPDQNILGKPLTFGLAGEKLKAASSVAVTGTLNHVIPAKSEDTARAAIKGFHVRNLVLSGDKTLPIALEEAVVDFNLQGSIRQALKATLNANFKSARMNVGGETSGNLFVTAVRSALSKVDNFSLSADIAGTLENYKMKISSDLDRVLKNAVGSVVKEQSALLEKRLKAEIQERTGPELKELQERYKVLGRQGTELTNVQNQLNAVLQDALKSAGGKGLRLR